MTTSDVKSNIIPGFTDFAQKFESILKTDEWLKLEEDFINSKRIFLVGNGGNLAVCDHGAIDISRLTDKSAVAPGSGILASSLINDTTHELWVKNWLQICLRGLDQDHISDSLLIGVSSSGYSKNICLALDYALSKSCKAALISARAPKIAGLYNCVKLDVGEYHTSEVLTLSLIYQLIHSAGFACPDIESSSDNNDKVIDYSHRE
mgnify:CR=1 FL=1